MDNKTHYVDRYIQRDPEWKRKKLLIEYFPTKRLSITTLLLQTKRLCKKLYFPFLFANKNDK